jgi:hypothetical protein
VSNVDSQASFENIVIQVIGEMSNNAATHRKFVQTFVLAEQPNGYFVLNDIFRYINEEEEIEEEVFQEEEAPVAEVEPKSLVPTEDVVEQSVEVGQVDKEAEPTASEEEPEAIAEDKSGEEEVAKVAVPVQEPKVAPSTNGTALPKTPEIATAEVTPVVAVAAPTEEPTEEEEPAAGGDAEPEKPKTPEPTPAVATPPLAPAQQPAAPPKPAAPKTWANLVARSSPTVPAIPSSTSSTPPAPAQPRVAPPPPVAQPKETSAPQTPQTSPGWQTAGSDHAKRQSRPQSISVPGDKETVMAYVKNVTEKVPTEALRVALQKFGELAYFDVSRPKVRTMI